MKWLVSMESAADCKQLLVREMSWVCYFRTVGFHSRNSGIVTYGTLTDR